MGTLFGKQKTTRSNGFVTFGLFLVTLALFTVVDSKQVSAQGFDAGGAANPTFTPGPAGAPASIIPAITPAAHHPDDGGAAGLAVDTADASATEVPQFDDPLYKLLYGFVITVFGTIFAWSGAIFDIGLNKFLLGFGDLYYNHNVGVAVEETWKIVRDLFNLTFIFGLVYIGFKMILDADDHHGRKMLVNLIGAALLVNFSLFIIKFLIDISDITAAVIAKGFSTTTSISNAFINVINLGTILKLSGEQIAALQTSGAFAYIFGIMIFLAVASFVFAAGGILLIIRFIVLNIYLVFSPIMFIGWVFPSFAHHSKKYMDGFLAQAFFAPAYLLMLYLSFKVLSTYADVQDVNYGALFVDGPVKANSAEMAIPFFILAMIFLVASLVVAKNMGAVGASTAVSFGNKLTGGIRSSLGNAAGGATAGIAARVGRNTVGAAAYAATNSSLGKSLASRGGRFGKSIYNATAGVADSSFDARQVGGLGKTMGIGDGKKGGFTTRVKEDLESDKKFLEKVGSIDEKKAAAQAARTQKVVNAETAKTTAESALATAKASLEADTAPSRTKITRLATEARTATQARKEEIAKDIQMEQAHIEAVTATAANNINNLQKKLAEATTNATDVLATETTKIQYKNSLQFIASLEKFRSLQTKAMTVGGAALGAVAATALTGGMAPILAALTISAGTAAVGGAAYGSQYQSKQNSKKIAGEYGDDGSKMKSSSAATKRLKELAKLTADASA